MVFVTDGKIAPGKSVRALLYQNESELTGVAIATANAGPVQCEVGSIAYTAGFRVVKQLDADGNWVEC